MKTGRSDFEGDPAPPDAVAPRRMEPNVRTEMRTAPDGETPEQREREDEPTEEPGYGHGV